MKTDVFRDIVTILRTKRILQPEGEGTPNHLQRNNDKNESCSLIISNRW